MTDLPPRYAHARSRAVDLAGHRGHRVADARHLLRVLLADLGDGRTSSAWLLHDAGLGPLEVESALERSLAGLVRPPGSVPAAGGPAKAARMLTRVVADAAALSEQRGLAVDGVQVLLVVCLGDPAVAQALRGLPGAASAGTRLWDRVVGPDPTAPHAPTLARHPHAS